MIRKYRRIYLRMPKKSIIIFLAVGVVLVFYFLLSNSTPKRRSGPRVINVVISFSKLKSNSRLLTNFNLTVSSLLRTTKEKIHFLFVGDEFSLQNAIEILPANQHFTFQTFRIEEYSKFVSDRLGDTFLSYFRYSADSYYGDALFFLSLLFHELPIFKDIDKILRLDCDLKIIADVGRLWDHFDLFDSNQLMGMTYEQSPVYRHVFSAFRSKNPSTPIGAPPHEKNSVPGFNSGVLLMDLHKLRNNVEYRTVLSLALIKRLAEKYLFKGHLGDQDVYTLMSTEYPKFFYRLDCGWNKQLCRWWSDHGGYADVFDLYNKCDRQVKIYHGNCNTSFPVESK